MKKLYKYVFIILIMLVSAICFGVVINKYIINKNGKNVENQEEKIINKSGVEYCGWLQTNGNQIQNEKGEKVQLRGISSHGIAWFSNLVTYNNLSKLKNEWNTNVFRIAMYTDPQADGYIAKPEANEKKVREIIEIAKKLDMYVIVDWHILKDNNPQMYEKEAGEFFDKLSKEYADTPNVIYEICNEPNGKNIEWNDNIKPYAENIIKIIRNNSPKSLIIVGTPDWCKDIDKAADNPLNYENIAYSCHFYAGSHGKNLEDKIDYCLEKNLPVFISECGITDSSGNGKIYKEDFKLWIDFLNDRNISWVYWSLSNKAESSSILLPEYNVNSKQETEVENNGNEKTEEVEEVKELDMDEYLTEAGKFLKSIFLK